MPHSGFLHIQYHRYQMFSCGKRAINLSLASAIHIFSARYISSLLSPAMALALKEEHLLQPSLWRVRSRSSMRVEAKNLLGLEALNLVSVVLWSRCHSLQTRATVRNLQCQAQAERKLQDKQSKGKG